MALLGVYGWRGTNGWNGVTTLEDWEEVAFKNSRTGQARRLDGEDLDSARENVQQRRAEASMGDRSMDVYLTVAAAAGPVTAHDVASQFEGMDNEAAGQCLRRLHASGYITRSVVVSSHCTRHQQTPTKSRRAHPLAHRIPSLRSASLRQ